ncbi:hypothetical protein QE152_g18965 [Popillia japonica]|uniref:Uncharacterized protein n=1 Tax=Popillia japonica TaxID=7064 RepID=A0AAW1L3S3_POPJA
MTTPARNGNLNLEQDDSGEYVINATACEYRRMHHFPIVFWKVNGKNLYRMDAYQEAQLKAIDIICLTETWLVGEDTTLPESFNELYCIVFSSATKEKSFGKTSGGLTILYKKQLKYRIIEKTNLWICCHFRQISDRFILMLNYWKPDADIYFCLKK